MCSRSLSKRRRITFDFYHEQWLSSPNEVSCSRLGDARRACAHQSSSVSSQSVKGPSFTRDTSMYAPKRPVSTRATSRRARSANHS